MRLSLPPFLGARRPPALVVCVLLSLCALVVGCTPDPDPGVTPSPSPSASAATPTETAAERRESAVKKAIERSHIKYPVLLDPDEKNWSRWGVRYWPTIYLVDKKGRIRDVWEGELAYDGKKGESILGDEVEKLLAE